MRKVKEWLKKSTATLLALIIFSGMIPSELISEIDFEGIFSSFTAMAEEVENELSGNKSAGSMYKAPECSFKDELYAGEDAISPLPSYKEYKENTGYTEPKRISFTDFREECGAGLSFDLGKATSFMSQEYKLMICNAEELYNYSMLVNGAGSNSEVSFYLSANIVLGDNIEYSEMSYDEYYFLPIGNEQYPFTGTFNGHAVLQFQQQRATLLKQLFLV